MDSKSGQRSAIGGDKSHFGEPKARVFERGQELRDVTLVGKDANGDVQIWSTLDQQANNELFENAGLLEPTS